METKKSGLIQKVAWGLIRVGPLAVNLASFAVLVGLYFRTDGNYWMTPPDRGFSCSDTTIMHPVSIRGQSLSRVSVVAFCLLFSLVVFILGEASTTGPKEASLIPLKVGKFWARLATLVSFRYWYMRVLLLAFMLSWGLVASSLLVNVLKNTIGTLRPQFFALCQPNVTCATTTDLHGPQDYYCTSGIPEGVRQDLHRSFPSGHATFSAAAAFFVIQYTHRRVKALQARVPIVVPAIQLTCLVLACWSSLTRVADSSHHPPDVGVGFVLGAGIGFAMAWYACQHLESNAGPKGSPGQDLGAGAVESGLLKLGNHDAVGGQRQVEEDQGCRHVLSIEVDANVKMSPGAQLQKSHTGSNDI